MRKSAITRFAIAAFLLILMVIVVVGFRNAGRWLIREDPLQNSDVIVVLSGDMPARAEEAAKVFRMGYAPEVWVSRPESSYTELATMGIAYTGEESYNREVLIRLGVPAAAIQIFPEPIVDTEQEVKEVSDQMRALNKRKVIIVTSPQHTRRVRALWRRIADDHQEMFVHAAWEDGFNADHWWRTTQDTFAVAREMMGLLNAWAGLPVRPQSAREPDRPETSGHP